MIRTATKWIIISVTIAILIWDVVAYCLGKDATVSEVLLSWARSYPIIPFAAGVLSGHLWWPQKISDD